MYGSKLSMYGWARPNVPFTLFQCMVQGTLMLLECYFYASKKLL